MSRQHESNRTKPEPSESFEERIDVLFEELALAFLWQRPSILLASYESEFIRSRAELALERRLVESGKKLIKFLVDEGHFDIPLLLSQHPDRKGSVFSVSGLSRGGGKAGANAYRALNIRREHFVDHAIRVVIWLTRQEAIDLSRHAPDFWAFRHREVEFDHASVPEQFAVPAKEQSERARKFPGQPEDLDDKITLYEAWLKDLRKQIDSDARQLGLLSALASLYRTKGAYQQSIYRLKRGMEIARELNDVTWLAKYWGELGLVYLEQEQKNRAVRAIRKAIRITPEDASLWSELGHFYHIMKRIPDAIIAYRQAIRLDPQNVLAHSSLVACYRLSGKADRADEQKKLAQPIMENETEYQRAVFESVCGNTAKAMKLLAIALQKKQAGVEEARRNPNFDFIREDALFVKVLGKASAFNGKSLSGKEPAHGN